MSRRIALPRLAIASCAAVTLAAALPSVASAAKVAVFQDPTYVDATDPGGEATNLVASLSAAGHTLTGFSAITAGDLDATLAAQDAVIFPEQEQPGTGVGAALSPAARQRLRDFVFVGGNLVLSAQHKGFLDDVFGFSIGTTGPGMNGDASKTVAAASSAYATGPATLPANAVVYGMAVSALPAEAKVIYQRAEGGVAYGVVVLIPYGAGTITYLGWDWFSSSPPFAAPVGKDGGWQALLSLSTTASTPTPALSVGDVNVNEGAATAFVPVTLSAPATGAVTATLSTGDGTATAGEDYTATTTTVAFAAGEQSRSIAIPVTSDTEREGNETFTVTLTSPAGAVLGRGGATVTILDGSAGSTTPKPCVSRRVVRVWLKIPKNAKVRATVAGKVVKVRNRVLTIDLRGKPKGTYRVVVKTAKGRVILRRTERTCVF